MQDDEGKAQESGLPAWINHVSLPSVIAGPAGRAISRLIGAAAEIPAAYLEGQAKLVSSSFQAKADLHRSMSAAAAEKYTQDPEIIERFGRRWLSDEIIRQSNRESISKKAITQLESESSGSENQINDKPQEDVDSDWLRRFGNHAQEVSQEEFQAIWAKMLAGEIRKPGSVSKAVLDTLAIVEADDIRLIENYANLRVNGNFIPLSQGEKRFDELIRLEELGLVQGSSMGFSNTGKVQDNGVGFLRLADKALVFFGPDNHNWTLTGVIATRKFSELADTLGFVPGLQSAKNAADIIIKEDWATTVYYARIIPIEGTDTIRFEPIEYFKQPENGALRGTPGGFNFSLDDE